MFAQEKGDIDQWKSTEEGITKAAEGDELQAKANT